MKNLTHQELKKLIDKALCRKGVSKVLAMNDLKQSLNIDKETSDEMTMKLAQIKYTKLVLGVGL